MGADLSSACEDLGGPWLPSESCDECPAPRTGDTDNNGTIGIEDLLNMLSAWGPSDPDRACRHTLKMPRQRV